MRNIPFLFWVLLLVDCEETIEKNVLKEEGESVTLEHDEIVGDDTMQWWFGGKMIAKFNKNNINEIYPGPNNTFSGRLKLDLQTGFLTIENISPEHGGLYELKIKSTKRKTIKFYVTVRVYKSMTEGDSFSLVIDVKQVDKIQWKFGDQVIPTDGLKDYDGKWGNIRLNNGTGELTITKIRRDQSGVYKAEINTNRKIVLGEFSITVEPRNSGVGSRISGASVALMVWAVTVFLLQEV